MARKPRLVAASAVAVLTIASWHGRAHLLYAQDTVRVSEEAEVVENPYATQTAMPPGSGRSSPETNETAPADGATQRAGSPTRRTGLKPDVEPAELAAPRPGATTYRNPFAPQSARPPINLPLRPGPISRWQRPSALPGTSPSLASDELRLSQVILSALPGESGANPGGDPIREASIDWDDLPPIEEMRASRAAQDPTIDVTPGPPWGTPPGSVRFAPPPPAQPNWMMPPPVPSPDLDKMDPFEVPGVGIAAASTTQQPTRSDTAGALGEGASTIGMANSSGRANDRHIRTTGAAADLTSVIISDYVDSPEGWYAQAERLAQTANSIDELSSVTKFCDRGLQGEPTPELIGSLQRLAAWAYNRRGELHSDAGRTREALADFQKAIGLDPNCSLAIHNRGVTLAQQNQPAEALNDFNRVIELNPGLAVAYRNRAELLASLGKMDEAIADYDRAIEQMNDDAELYRARAYAWQRMGNFARALADLNQSLKLAPKEAATFTQRGHLAAERGDYGQAIRDFKRALENAPQSAQAYRGLAWLWATCPDPQFRDAEQALAAAKKSAELATGEDSFTLDALAAAHARAGQFNDAVRTAQRAIAIAPSDYAAPLQERLRLYQQRRPYATPSASTIRTTSHQTPPR